MSPWLFTPPLVPVIHALKFARCPHLGEALARPLAVRLRELRPAWQPRGGATSPHLVAAVPLHPFRRFGRGYDQAVEIARPLARLFGLPFIAALRRRRPTRHQSRLPRAARHANVAAAFAVKSRTRSQITGRAVLLVDDVATTGATLDAASRALRDAGAQRVIALAVAYTPPPAPPKPDPDRRRT